MEQGKKIKVLYFAGSGRSGSTILNIILGNHPQIFGGGELQNMREVYNDSKICSCQNVLVNCEFWSSVVNDWFSKVEEDSTLSGFKKWSAFEGVFSFRAWFKMYFGIGEKSTEFKKYQMSTSEFLRAVQEHSKKEVLVDISKNPLRAWALEKNPDIDLRMVHLVRDGRAVTWSLKRTAERQNRNRPTWRAAIFWALINRMTNLVRSKVEHKTLVRYEDFIENPRKILTQIGEMAEIDFSDIINKIENNADFSIEHVMAGNGIRKADTIKFETTKTDGWMQKLKPSSKNLFKVLSYSSLRKFNYS
ncbi:sulfotransferase [Muricauda sp. CAU 1633]|uniref:sulfotransferase n=1 Tax=Allomuricauda sp. CAU 1633 TaxID=2816036 RepID=UPI001A8FC527|nr:sulfotransferase [Muricauda sp. CAU 1633]MBO0323559.1 sulfotransferase [Muricauda sp. CAU 1633]